MSNYRSFYGLPSWADSDRLTPKQRRRGERKTERDLLAGGEPPRHPNRGMGISGNPARRAEGHYVVASWGGEPGECGEECVCGLSFDGFDTIREAGAFMDRHISDAPRPRTRQPLRGSFSRYVAVRRPAPPPEPMFPSVEHQHRYVDYEPRVRRPGQPAWARRFDLVERAS